MGRSVGHAPTVSPSMHTHTLCRLSQTANLVFGPAYRRILLTPRLSSLAPILSPYTPNLGTKVLGLQQLLLEQVPSRPLLTSTTQYCTRIQSVGDKSIGIVAMKEDKEGASVPAAKGRQTSIASFFGSKPGPKVKGAEKVSAPEVAAKDVVQAEVQGANGEKKKRVRSVTQGAPEKATSEVAPADEAEIQVIDAVEAGADPPHVAQIPEAVETSHHVASGKEVIEEGALAAEEAAPKAKRRRRLVKASNADEAKKVPVEGQAEMDVNKSIETEAAGAAVEDPLVADKQAMEEDTVGKGVETMGEKSTQDVRSFFTRKAPRRTSSKKDVRIEKQEGKADDDEAVKGLAKGGLKKGKAEASEGVQVVIPAAELSERETSPSPEEIEEEDVEGTLLVTEAVSESH